MNRVTGNIRNQLARFTHSDHDVPCRLSADRCHENVEWIAGDFMGDIVRVSTAPSPLRSTAAPSFTNPTQIQSPHICARLLSLLCKPFIGFFESTHRSSGVAYTAPFSPWDFMQTPILYTDAVSVEKRDAERPPEPGANIASDRLH